MNGIILVSAKKIGNKFEFTFDDVDARAPVLAMSFLNSDFSRFDNHVRSLKKMLYQG